jgi:hypothetical protein
MFRTLLAVFAALLGCLLSLGSVLLLLWITLKIEMMENAWLRAAAILGALVAGVVLLMGSVFFSTRTAVLIFGEKSSNAAFPGINFPGDEEKRA